MGTLFRKFFGIPESPSKDFSDFFNKASEREKVSLLERVAKEANEDQKRLIEESKSLYHSKKRLN